MSETAISLADALAYLDAARRRHIRKLALIRTLWVGLVFSALCFYLDAVAALTGRQRLALSATFTVAVAATYVLTRIRLNRTGCREKMLARLIESEHPEMNNDLVNAIDFDQRIKDRQTENVSVVLMKRGIDLAVNKFDQVEDLDSLELPTMRAESRILKGVLAAWVLLAAIFYGWFFAEVPRFLDPFGDHPRYSPTKLIVDPAGTIVDYGQDLTITVTAKGPMPKAVTLVAKSTADEVLSEVGMLDSGDGAFFQTIENIRSEMIFHAAIERGRSKYHRIRLSKIPRIESVLAHYQYPDYTGISEKTRVLTDKDSTLKGYQGTQVTMAVQSNRPLKTGTVTVGNRQYQCQSESEDTVQATFPLVEDGEFSVVVTDIEGNTSADKFAGKIRLIADNKPYVSIVSPGMNSLAIPTAIIPIVIEAQDDLGIQNVSIFRNHNESEDARRMLFDANEAEGYVRVAETFDLGDLGLRPGDTIDYYATATDSLPRAPQTAASESFTLQIISEEEYARFMQSQMTAKDLRLKYDNIFAKIDELLRAQQQLQRETSDFKKQFEENQADPNSQSIKDRLQELAQKQAELGEKTRSLSTKLQQESQTAPVFDIEKDYKTALSEFAKRLDNAKGHMNAGADKIKEGSASPGNCSGSLAQAGIEQKKALEELGQQTQELRDTIQQANREIEKMYNLMADVETFKQLYLAQKHLTRQTRSLSHVTMPDFDTRVRLKGLAEDEAFIKNELNDLKQRLREHGAQIEKEYPKVAGDAYTIAREIERRNITELMQEGEDFLNNDNGQEAYPKVHEAYAMMHAMISFCESAGGKGCKQCEFRLKIQMMLNPGNTMNQLAQSLGMGMPGMGMGFVGAMGRGASGFGGGQSNLAMFGGDTFGQNLVTDGSMMGTKRVNAETMEGPRQLDPLADNIEELSAQRKTDTEFEVEGQDRMMAEYNRLIEAYFQRLAEDK
ncbi:MAG: coiled-coil domain-containing protein [Planctomycetota bacterium]|jgi:hypothetical protein